MGSKLLQPMLLLKLYFPDENYTVLHRIEANGESFLESHIHSRPNNIEVTNKLLDDVETLEKEEYDMIRYFFSFVSLYEDIKPNIIHMYKGSISIELKFDDLSSILINVIELVGRKAADLIKKFTFGITDIQTNDRKNAAYVIDDDIILRVENSKIKIVYKE